MFSRVCLLLSGLLCFACNPRRTFPPEEPPPSPVVVTETALAPRSDGVTSAGEAEDPMAAGCVRSWPEARLRSYAYDHVVHLGSSCHRIASCTVATNLNPKPIVVAVPPGEELEVVTSRGSEMAEFTPEVRCSRGTR